MKYNKKLGWILLLSGMVITFLTIWLVPKPTSTIGTIIGLSVIWLIIIPLLIIGSTLAGGSPKFVEDRLKKSLGG